ncbi:tRNA (adenosine(37)-N6)-threonylcarbamoyltransferase complex transferase subunit TsaD [Candidatus Uhrbacteria bacterium RIFCSPHIGHO2_02_FULL_60_10]|uniref:tRNA N6-adenosine threonylcarbamoyltransferase n=1 Tax=Candidatus Uhrbacteria bacterium RIFCSPHIGHO2_02_FULL_60_10 TaxID=1802392 RepID=A0A1F7U608_9BACT|nr:MAG: tRNA (adenosine(37)-N6)-threonylcarbamoyltransferase complex transferase subunit TsaD [Candidatus Uhrbacteria bacterium RIFCSPHIGHO2_02_FULL_60_10]
MRILALESSCDESAAAWLDVSGGRIRHLHQLVATQEIHAKYGGVVPEVAAREHAVMLPPLLAALAEKVVGRPDGRLLGKKVDVVAATRGPGLITSLRVGLDTARTLAGAWGKKFVGINHVEGHIYANWLGDGEGRLPADRDIFPAVALVVSGGHTELLYLRGHGRYELLGATLDDAAGEAFDKTAKLMGLGYPGGPALSRLAANGNRRAFDFPRPLLREKNLNFSYSGLKTAVRYFLERERARLTDEKFRQDVAASTEEAIVDVLVGKAAHAVVGRKCRSFLLAGGVAANGRLRQALAERLAAVAPEARLIEPPLKYCTDNAAMIAMAAYWRAKRGDFDALIGCKADAGWELGR